MARSKIDIRLHPDRCDHCGKCARVCEPESLKVGPSYIYLDWRTCTECMRCVQVCERQAIVRHSTEPGAAGARKPTKRRTPSAPVPAAHATTTASSAGGEGEAGREAAGAAAGPRRGLLERAGRASGSEPAGRGRGNASESERTGRASESERAVPSVGPVAWTPLEAVAVASVAIATFLGKDALLGLDIVAVMPAQGRMMARAGVLVAFYAIQLAVLAFLAHKRGTTLFAAFGLTRVRATARRWFSAAGWVFLLLLATRVGAWVWGVIAQAIGIDAPSAGDTGLTSVFGAGSVGLVLSVVLVVIVAPIVEEMLFRGVILTALGAAWGPGIALVGSAALFAAYHFSLWMFVPMLLLGLACGYLAEHRGSLWPAVALHVLFNAVPVAIAFIAARA